MLKNGFDIGSAITIKRLIRCKTIFGSTFTIKPTAILLK